MHIKIQIIQAIFIFTLASVFSSALAQEGGKITGFEQAIRHAVANNPEVLAAYHQFEASSAELRAGKGGFLPSLDVSGEYSENRLETPIFQRDSFKSDAARLTLTQMLFDGFETWYEVDQLTDAQRAAYYELRQVSEEVALEAGRAYFDVLRYQALASLAEDNLAEHHKIFDHVKQRAEAGISRGVDLEQASARLALADFNLLQEVTNLHDVVTRFQRVVTALPADDLPQPALPESVIPGTRTAALLRAYETSPVLQRAIANLEAAQAAAKKRRSAYMPTVNLRARAEEGHDLDGLDGYSRDQAVELVFSYNLYRGGSDLARRRQALREEDRAYDLRVKACHDVRENMVIAYNDISSIQQRLVLLAKNELSIEKARFAYRKQFDIGERTLLDLLDSENEYFDVSRALVNAKNDLALAKLRSLSTMGLLTESMGVEGRVDPSKFGRRTAGCATEEGPSMQDYFNRRESLLAQLRKGDQRAYRMDVRFKFDSDKVDASYDKDLADAATYLRENPEINAQILGHTDSVGSEDYNRGLSQRRANSVREVLIRKYGIAVRRLDAIGKGEGEPVAANDSRVGRAQNRRVEFIPLIPEKRP